MNWPLVDPGAAQELERRELLVEAFRASLERAAPEVAESAAPVDLATLLGEMAVLKNELRLQSRQFRNTLEELHLFGNDLRQHGERLQRELERARAESAAIREQTAKQFLLELLDLRDRLQSGVDAAARPPPPSWFARFVPGPTRFAASLAEGQRLTLQRLDDLLASHAVRPLPVLGEIFDPQRMCAVGVETAAADIPDGTVVHELQRGYFHDGKLLRAAQVIVSKKAGTT